MSQKLFVLHGEISQLLVEFDLKLARMSVIISAFDA